MGSGSSRQVHTVQDGLQERLQQAQTEAKQAKAEAESFQARLATAIKEKEELKAHLDDANGEISRQRESVTDFQAQLQSAEADIAQRTSTQRENERLQMEAKQAKAEAESFQAKLATAIKEKEELKAHLDDANGEISRQRESVTDFQAQLQSAEADIAQRTSTQRENEKLQMEAKQAKAEAESFQAKLATAIKEKEELKAHLDDANGEISRQRESVTDLQAQLQSAEADIAQRPSAERENDNLQTTLQAPNPRPGDAVEQQDQGKTVSEISSPPCAPDKSLGASCPDDESIAAPLQPVEEPSPVDFGPNPPPKRVEERFQTAFMASLWRTIQTDMLVVSWDELNSLPSIPRSDDHVTEKYKDLPDDAKVVFVSHRWFRPEADFPHPDNSQGSKLHLILDGCKKLAERMHWNVKQIYCWIDFCCIDQDDQKLKVSGINSLLGYAAACDALLIPCSTAPARKSGITVDQLPEYGARGWTRLESMTFHFVSAFLNRPVGIETLMMVAAKNKGGDLFSEFVSYKMGDESTLASKGVLFEKKDRKFIKEREQAMFECVRNNLDVSHAVTYFANQSMLAHLGIKGPGAVTLASAFPQPSQAADSRKLTRLDLRGNDIGDQGAKAVATALKPSCNAAGTYVFHDLKEMHLEGNGIGDEGWTAIAVALQPQVDPDGRMVQSTLTSGGLSFLDSWRGDAKAKAIADYFLTPKQAPTSTWVFNDKLKKLDLRDHAIGDIGATAIGHALAAREDPNGTWAVNRILTVLNLSGNRISDSGWTEITVSLQPRVNPDGTMVQSALTSKELNVLGPWRGEAMVIAIADHFVKLKQSPKGTWLWNVALDTLRLSDNKIGEKGATALRHALVPKRNPDDTWVFNGTLGALYLNDNDIGMGVRAIASVLQPRKTSTTFVFNAALTTLDLGCNAIPDEGARVLAEALQPRENPNNTWIFPSALKILRLHGNKIGDKGAEAFAGILMARKNADGTMVYNHLECLDLRQNSITDIGAKAVAGAFTTWQCSTGSVTKAFNRIWLSGNKIGDAGAKAVVAALPAKVQQGCSTWVCPDIDGGTQAVSATLLAPWTSTTELESKSMDMKAAKDIAEVLAPVQTPEGLWAYLCRLTKLDLAQSKIGVDGAKAIAEALKAHVNPDGRWVFNGALKELHLWGNRIGDEGAKALAAALQPRQNPDKRWVFNGALEELNLSCNGIGDEGARALAAALEPRQNHDKTWSYNGALERLHLYENNIGAEGAKALAAALEPRQNPDKTWSYNGALADLSLTGNQIGDEGAKAIAAALQPQQNPDKTWVFNGALKELSLWMNKIGDEGAKALAAALEPRQNPDKTWVFNGALNTLYIGGNSLSDEAKNRLVQVQNSINTHRADVEQKLNIRF